MPKGEITLTREEAMALMETLRLAGNFAFDERQQGLAEETTVAFELLELKISAASSEEKVCKKCCGTGGVTTFCYACEGTGRAREEKP